MNVSRDRLAESHLRRAVILARRGLGGTNPNPAVGCVIARGARVVGEGFHQKAGGPHAEAWALAQAGPRARGATAYVTLEPCAPNAAKRTPPCASALVAAGVKEVVYAAPDLNPRVRGRGARILARSRVHVRRLDPANTVARGAALLAQHFNVAESGGRPFVTLKAGVSVDGKIATETGRSKWITSPAQRKAARRLRGLFDAILIGSGTALKDDPLLLPAPRPARRFVRVVLDRRLRVSRLSRLVRTASRLRPVWFVTTQSRVRSAAGRRLAANEGVRLLSSPAGVGAHSVQGILRRLKTEGLRSVLVEGGGAILGSFVAAGAFDELVLFRASALIGGDRAPGLLGGAGVRSLEKATRLRPIDACASLSLSFIDKSAQVEAWALVRSPKRRRARARR
jgi:diaminohydroxyphosphoribosylaminopyrimidine deaminase/5-amino-6-(5-phosphoribosylamino)uracil reductase